MLDNSSAPTFDEWCRSSLFTPAVLQATRVLEEYCDLQLQAVYRQLELAAVIDQPRSGEEVAAAKGYVPSAATTMHALLYRLSRHGDHVRAEGEGLDARFVHARAPEDPSARLAELREQMTALGPEYPAALDFVDFGVEHFQRSLRDEPDFMDKLLSGRDPTFGKLWHAATNLDPLQDLHGRMGAELIHHEWKGGTILEIGGGTGNGIRHLLRRFAASDTLSRIERYVFTDISHRFVLTTRKEIKRDYPGVDCDWTFLDLNRPLGDAKIPEQVSLIYAVNAAHVAKDIVAFLQDCRDRLAPGGMVVFAERVRIDPYLMAPRELALNLSVYHRSAAQRTADRPMHCYLSPRGWNAVLKEAGLEPQLYPDLPTMHEHFPQQYAAVVVGRKPS